MGSYDGELARCEDNFLPFASSTKSRKSAESEDFGNPGFPTKGVIFRAAFKIWFYILGGLAGFRSNPHKSCYQTAPKHYPLRAHHGRIRATASTNPSNYDFFAAPSLAISLFLHVLHIPTYKNTLDPLTYDVLGAIERGDYAAALSPDAARLVFSFANSCEFDDATTSAALFYSQVERSIDAFLCDGASEEPWLRFLDASVDANSEYRVAVVLCLGVAAFLAFLQQNVTGPVGKFSHFPLPFGCFGEFGNVGNGAE